MILYFKHLELLVQVILGLGLIIWLQEDERSTNQQLTAKLNIWTATIP